MVDKEDNPGFVRVVDCRDRHSKIELALFGEDLRGGMVKDIGDIKNYIQQANSEHKEEKKEKKEGSRAWRAFLFSVVGGAIVALMNYIFHH